jgi:hypothetical protein
MDGAQPGLQFGQDGLELGTPMGLHRRGGREPDALGHRRRPGDA